MPYINNDGVRIFYLVDGNEEGPPLVLMHGTSNSLEDWYEAGWVKGLKDDFRLILIDHRGHGHSDKPHDTQSYSLELSVSDIAAVLDALNISRAYYFGYSMGGWIGLGIGKYAPDRFHALVIGASHPYERSMEGLRKSFSQGMEAYLENDIPSSRGLVVTDWYKVRRLANDHMALMALTQDRPDISDVIPTMTMPCLVYAGDADPLYAQVKECAGRLPNARFVSLPGLDHGQGFRYSHEALPHVKKFLSEVSRQPELARGD